MITLALLGAVVALFAWVIYMDNVALRRMEDTYDVPHSSAGGTRSRRRKHNGETQ